MRRCTVYIMLDRLREAVTDRLQMPNMGIGIANEKHAGDYSLLADEQGLIHPQALPKRKTEFTLGRTAARAALHRLGHPAVPILKGERGEPIWPQGIVGSITHSYGTAIAFAGNSSDYTSIGVDLESVRVTLSPRSVDVICVEEEREWVLSSDRASNLRLLQLFSAKEAVYKAVYPLLRTELTFKDAVLRWDRSTDEGFFADIQAGGWESRLYVYSSLIESYVFSWICVKA
jgi:4'-phosphopantetheinyl transferase EntD